MSKGAGANPVDAVVLAGAVGHEPHWSGGLPRSLLPLPGSTLIETLLDRLFCGLPGGCAVCANGHTEQVRGSLGRPNRGQVLFYEDRLPRGTAGCLKDCATRLSADTVVLTGGSVWLEDDLNWMLGKHRAQGNAVTVCCERQDHAEDWAGHRALKPAGLFICDRGILEYIRPSGFQDLKEQTIPALCAAGLRVGALELQSGTSQVVDWHSYMRVVERCLRSGLFATSGMNCVAPGIWVGRDVEIAPTARVVGPVFLGAGSRVADRAVILGPVMFGERCDIGAETWVVRTVGERHVRVPPATRLVDRLLRGPEHAATFRSRELAMATGTNWVAANARFSSLKETAFSSQIAR